MTSSCAAAVSSTGRVKLILGAVASERRNAVMQITLLGKHQREDGDVPSGKAKKAFLRKTARGAVVKVLREHYLRPDVPCGAALCEECSDLYGQAPTLTGQSKPSTSKPVLSQAAREPTTAHKSRHYLILDTNILLHQMDAVEAADFGKDIIVLQTVLEEVRHRSMPLYNRVLALIGDEARRFFVFSNEARQETYVTRLASETPNDRNDRAIRVASKWYAAHLAKAQSVAGRPTSTWVNVVLLTNDVDNYRKARADGLQASSFKGYLESLPADKSGGLLDLMAAMSDTAEAGSQPLSGRKPVLFKEYLSTTALMAGVKAGQLHQGIFNPNPYNYLEATVKVPKYDKPILIVGRTDMNRATSGDAVAIELLPQTEWKRPTDNVVERTTLKNDNPEESAETAEDGSEEEVEEELARPDNVAELQPTARVVGVVRRAWRSFVCVIDKASIGDSALDSLAPQHVFAIPVDRKLPKIRIRTRQISSLLSQKFLVAIDAWDAVSRHPAGHFVRALGQVDSKEAEIESLLLEYDVPYRPFPKAILDCLPEEGDKWQVPPLAADSAVWRGRQDLRDLIVCSIDPIGCQDIDDALHARRLPNGRIEAGVHIADVSHFVQPNNPMDAEASSRGTTVYLVDKRIDMLPPLLGTNLCSLRPYVERLAFSVIWEMDEDANIHNARFTKSVIASKAAFSYEDAQLRKDDPSRQDELTASIRLLNTLAIQLRAKRMAAGALNLASPEVKIHLDSAETSGPIDVEQKKLLETNSLVEEFMLLANISVAQRIFDQFPQTAVLRRHLAPPSANFEVLADILKKRRGMSLDISSSGALAASLDECVDPAMPTFNTLVRIMATRCMLPAEYFCSGTVARDTFGHYGLASTIYTHFTSPIRRYADVLVHRELYAAISETPLNSSLHSTSHVEDIMDNINKRHRSAQRAGRASIDFYVTLSLRSKQESKIAVVEEAYVIRAFRNGLAVFVSKFGLEGLITFRKDIQYNAEDYEIVVNQNGRDVRIGVFDKVTVVIEVDRDEHTQRGKVRMHLVDPVDSKPL